MSGLRVVTTRPAVEAVVLVTAVATYVAGVAWLLPIVVVALLIDAIGQRATWAMALAAATITPLAVLAALMALSPTLGLPLGAGITATLAILGAVSIAAVHASGRRRPSRPALVLAASALTAPVAAGVMALIGRARGAGASWALWNDASFHLLGTRVIIDDGGLDVSGGNRDPLASELLAVFTLPGREGVAVQDLLQFDSVRQALVVLLILAWMSVVIAVLVGSAVPLRHAGTRAGAAALAGLLPWTWFVSGFAVRLGHINALLAALILLATWLVWVEARSAPVLASAIMMLAAVALLATWAVLAVVPMALGGWLILKYARLHVRLRRWRAAGWLACLVGSGCYAVAVTMHDVRPRGGIGLSAEGGFVAFEPFQPGLVLAGLLGVSFFVTRSTRDTWERCGVLVFAGAALVGLGLLLAQRTGPGVTLWGYYPQKYSWILCVMAVTVCARFVAHGVSANLSRRRDRLAAPIVVVAAAVALMLSAPPSASPLVARGWAGLKTVAPLTTVVDGRTGDLSDDLGFLEPDAAVLYEVADPDRRVILSRYLTDPVAERWVDDWVVQLARSRREPVSRELIADLDLRRTADLCLMVRAWGPGVIVRTRDAGLSAEVEETCGDAAAEVVVDPAVEGVT